MKTVRNLLGVLMLTAMVSGITSNLLAQGRGNERRRENPGRENQTAKRAEHDRSDRSRPDNKPNKDKDWDRDHNNHDRDHRDYNYDRNRSYDRHARDYYTSRNNKYYHHGRYITYHHRHDRYRWAPAYGYRYNTRYIFYRDYNVYYDCYRDVFVTWNGRFWVVTAVVPEVICHLDFGRTTVVGVDYWDDDFDFYLTRRRPAYISIQASW